VSPEHARAGQNPGDEDVENVVPSGEAMLPGGRPSLIAPPPGGWGDGGAGGPARNASPFEPARRLRAASEHGGRTSLSPGMSARNPIVPKLQLPLRGSPAPVLFATAQRSPRLQGAGGQAAATPNPQGAAGANAGSAPLAQRLAPGTAGSASRNWLGVGRSPRGATGGERHWLGAAQPLDHGAKLPVEGAAPSAQAATPSRAAPGSAVSVLSTRKGGAAGTPVGMGTVDSDQDSDARVGISVGSTSKVRMTDPHRVDASRQRFRFSVSLLVTGGLCRRPGPRWSRRLPAQRPRRGAQATRPEALSTWRAAAGALGRRRHPCAGGRRVYEPVGVGGLGPGRAAPAAARPAHGRHGHAQQGAGSARVRPGRGTRSGLRGVLR
jgi:hypothetical protein